MLNLRLSLINRYGRTCWGASSTCLRRIVEPAYADKRGIPRGGWAPRLVSGWFSWITSVIYILIYVLSLKASSSNACNRDADSPLPNARMVSIEFHPSITPGPQDNTVSENECFWHEVKRNIYTNQDYFFAGHLNGYAIWPIPWPWYFSNNRKWCWKTGTWLLQRRGNKWSLWARVLPNFDSWLWPHIFKLGKRNMF